jgi:6-phosphogluconolactonase
MAARLRGPLNVFPNVESMSLAVARAFVSAAAVYDPFAVALTGGTTPEPLYHLLATTHRSFIPWQRVHLFWSDERYVAPGHPESNVGMARRALIDHIPIPEANVHPPNTVLTDPEESAAAYEAEIRAFLGPEPRFDWMLLGLGEDGHVASLFPGGEATKQRERLVVAVRDSPKPPPVRLTMTPPLINRSREIHMLVTGASKRKAVKALTEGRASPWLVPPTLWMERQAANPAET